MRNKSSDLTTRQKEILTYIKQYYAKNKYTPSIRNICEHFNLSSSATVKVHLDGIIEKGFLRRDSRNPRYLEIMVPNEFEQSNNDVVSVPLLGKITAGNPIEAIETPDEYFPLPVSLIPNNKEIFTLRVNGESMINAGIHDNDIIIVERVNTAKNGDIVVAMNDENEVTLKTFYKEKNYFRLQPENDFMAPIILKNVSILGKAIGLYRKI
jgi:repressor LexA